MTVRLGVCNYGVVRLETRGELIRVGLGLCHCTVFRRETGGPYLAFAAFPEAAVMVAGKGTIPTASGPSSSTAGSTPKATSFP